MKTKTLLFSLLLLHILSSCVQKSYKRTVVFTLDVSQKKNVKTVGISGKDNPLSWDEATKMNVVKKDSIYQIVITGETGYKFTEVKFVVNDTFELKNQENRRIYFDKKKDTTFYKAKFNEK